MKKTILWILVVSAMTAIFLFSSQEARESSELSKGFISTLIEFFDFNNSLSAGDIKEISVAINGIVRTGAHFIIYAVLGFFLALLMREYRFFIKNFVFYSTLGSFLYACTDELHQHFVPGRSAQLFDLVTDTLGALFGSFLVIFIIKIYRKITW